MIADKSINLDTLYKVVFDNEKLELSKECIRKVEESFDFLQSFSSDKIIYGINTGFGPMAQYRIEDQSLIELQYNIIRSHSTGAGKPLPELYVKAAMIARLYTFLQGKSGVHMELVSLLCEFINRGIYPFIPEHGSVGASGDLVQLAHIALTLIGEGEVFYQGKLRDAATVLEENGLQPFSMRIREGLSVTNGTSVMTGIGIVNLIYAKKLLRWSVAASVMMNEIAASYDDFMAQALNEAKHHKGQQEIAAMMREWVAGSTCVLQRENELYNQVHKEKIFEHKVHPYYSLRCVPQILGPVFFFYSHFLHKTLLLPSFQPPSFLQLSGNNRIWFIEMLYNSYIFSFHKIIPYNFPPPSVGIPKRNSKQYDYIRFINQCLALYMPCFFHYSIRLYFYHQIFNVIILPERFIFHLFFIIDPDNDRAPQSTVNMNNVTQNNTMSKSFSCSATTKIQYLLKGIRIIQCNNRNILRRKAVGSDKRIIAVFI